MKLFVIAAILWPMLVFSQSAIPKAVNETLNLAPRCKKGDLQRYHVDIELRRYDDNGNTTYVRKDVLAYSQYCAANSPDIGLRYEVTVDSFAVGVFDPPDRLTSTIQSVPQLVGYRINSAIKRELPTANGCYDIGLTFPDTLFYVEIYEFLENYVYVRLLEQLRYSAGRQLSKIGDSVVVKFPAPICYKVKDVVNDYKLTLAPQVLKLKGITNHLGKPCAIVESSKSSSKLAVNYWAGDAYSIDVNGQLTLQIGMLIDVETGAIRSAEIYEYTRVLSKNPDKTESTGNASRKFTLSMLN